MITYETKVTIRRRPDEVFAALLDPARYGQWTEMVDTRFDDPVPRIGTTGEFRLPGGPLKGRYRIEITALDPNHRLDIRIDGAGLRWLSRVSLERDSEGTVMTYAGDISLLGWRRILEPIMSREAQAGEAREAERLRDLLEAESPEAVALAGA